MEIVYRNGCDDIAILYVGRTKSGNMVEFVESVTPPLKREDKWVLIVSTLSGCPVGCVFCDAGGRYRGPLSFDEIIEQIDYMVINRFKNRKVSTKKFKIQFARIGEPAFNDNVLKVIDKLDELYDCENLMPCVSTIAPVNRDSFFDSLLEIKKKKYSGRFQLQFSIHTTDKTLRDKVIPFKKWDFDKIASYGEKFYEKGDRKITLNFALGKDFPLDADVLLKYFNPEVFLIKITPVNPTYKAQENGIESYINPDKESFPVIDSLKSKGFEVILSIGELKENEIGSNCGQTLKSIGFERTLLDT